MANIQKFLKVVEDFGIPESSKFSPLDLYDEKDMGRVIACILAFAEVVPRVAPEFQGPVLPPFRGEFAFLRRSSAHTLFTVQTE